MKQLIFALLIIITGSLYCQQQTITDTLYVIPELDGGMSHCPELDYYGIDTTFGTIYVGDLYSQMLWGYFFNRSFLSFPLPEIPQGYFLQSANLFIYQLISTGNDVIGVYPIFDMGNNYTIEPPCLLEHIDYGFSLDWTDFFLNPLHVVGIISNTPDIGWRSMDVTDYVFDDIQNERVYSQYRLRLAVNTDNDPYMDGLHFNSGDAPVYEKPHIVYVYEQESNADNDSYVYGIAELSNYPNPFNPSTTIQFSGEPFGQNEQITIEIFNIKGQRINQFNIHNSKFNINEVVWDGTDELQKPVSSGVYLYKLVANGKTEAVKKCLLMK